MTEKKFCLKVGIFNWFYTYWNHFEKEACLYQTNSTVASSVKSSKFLLLCTFRVWLSRRSNGLSSTSALRSASTSSFKIQNSLELQQESSLKSCPSKWRVSCYYCFNLKLKCVAHFWKEIFNFFLWMCFADQSIYPS